MTKSSFESDLGKLETLVEKLEKGELTLDESIKSYEEGVKLYQKCKQKLGEAQSTVLKLNDELKLETIEE